jgi:prepilin-type N-terminal cleavage/methylation domain-containing protein
MLKHFKQKRKAGFTLVETLIAISILIISISGPLVIISQALKSSYYARDEITAFYLAQEAVEFIRNQRDINGLRAVSGVYYSDTWLNSVGWDITIPSTPVNLVNPYKASSKKAELVIDAGVYKLKQCVLSGGTKCPALKYDGNGTYAYGDILAPSNSNFTREIIMTEPPPSPPTSGYGASNTRELIVFVRVSWTTGSHTNNVTLREHITNWELEKTPS